MLTLIEGCKLSFSLSKRSIDPVLAIAHLDIAKTSLADAIKAQDGLGVCLFITGIDEAKAALEAQEAKYRAAGHYTAANKRAAARILRGS